MELISSPWVTVLLGVYALVAVGRRWPYRWVGVGALIFLFGSAAAVALELNGVAERSAQASYSWFVAFAVGLVGEVVFRRDDSTRNAVTTHPDLPSSTATPPELVERRGVDGVRRRRKRSKRRSR